MFDPPPMPNRVELHATVRDLGSLEVPVARLTFTDVEGNAREIDLDQEVAWTLLEQLVRFHQTLRTNLRQERWHCAPNCDWLTTRVHTPFCTVAGRRVG